MNTRTNIVLDDKLVAKAMKRAGVKTKKAAVEAALKAYVARPDFDALLALRGSGVIADDYDPKAPCGVREGFTPHMVSETVPEYPVRQRKSKAPVGTKS
jgi:Arc/MetJ family transcription regulator